MDKSMSKSNGVKSTRAPSSEINLLGQPMPLIPILNSNINSGINVSSGYYLQDIMPVPSSDAMAADNNNLNHEFSLTPENPLTNPVHRRFYSDPTFSNNAYHFSSEFGAASGGHADAYRNSAAIFDDEALSNFFNVNEYGNSSPSAISSQVGALSDANMFRSTPTLPPRPPTPIRFDLGIGTSNQRMKNPMLEMGASSSNSSINLLIESRRRHLSNDELAEIFRVDPRRAKRILANRKSAAKLKEKKEKHKAELEDMVQFLQARVATLRTQVEEKKSEISSLIAENKRLQFLLEAAEQNYQLKGALNEVLNDEVLHLNLMASNAGVMGDGQRIHPGYNNNPTHDLLVIQQLQLLGQQPIQDGNNIGNVSDVSSSDDNMEEN